MQKTLAAILLATALFGCTLQPEKPPQTPDQNNDVPDKNSLDVLKGLDVFTKGGKPISLDLDQNRIKFGFEFDLQKENIDLNVLFDSCNAACSALDSNRWTLKKTVDDNSFLCYCTEEVCIDEESATQITRYCTDRTIGFRFENS